MSDFLRGISYFFAGVKLVQLPGLRRFIIIPVIINIVLFVGLFVLLWHYFGEFNHWVMLQLPYWLQWLMVFFWLIFFVSFFLLLIYSFVTVANILAAPFNTVLAEKVKVYLTGQPLPNVGVWDSIKDAPRSIWRQFQILGFYLPRAFIFFLLFFVPMLQPIVGIIWFFFHAWFMALTYVDYPSDLEKYAVSSLRMWLRQRKGVALGLGSSVLVFSMVPVLNFFVIPAAVAGATKLWVDEKQ